MAKEFEREIEPGEPASLAVVEAVSAVDDTDPLELPPLSDAIDGDGIDLIFQGSADPTLSFQYHGYEVVVDSRTVSVTALQD